MSAQQVVTQQDWKKIQELTQHIKSDVESKEKLAKFQEEKEVNSNGNLDGVGCIFGSATIKCNDVKKVIKLEETTQIDSKTPKEQRHGLALRQVYKCPDNQNITLIHQVNESPVMLVSSRSFVFVRYMIETEDSVTFYVESYDCENIKDEKKVVRGQILQYTKYSKIDDKTIKGETFFYVDPKGSIPLKLFNTQLEGQLGQLKYVKKTLEKENVE